METKTTFNKSQIERAIETNQLGILFEKEGKHLLIMCFSIGKLEEALANYEESVKFLGQQMGFVPENMHGWVESLLSGYT